MCNFTVNFHITIILLETVFLVSVKCSRIRNKHSNSFSTDHTRLSSPMVLLEFLSSFQAGLEKVFPIAELVSHFSTGLGQGGEEGLEVST